MITTLLFGLAQIASSPNPSEWETLFDGTSIDKWQQVGHAIFEIQGDSLYATSNKERLGWLCTKREYGDFILEVDVKATDGNSGIQIRSHVSEGKPMVGYQIEIDTSERAWSGGLYEQGRRGWLNNLLENEPARKAFKVGEWNHYRIHCEGDRIRSWVNGIAAADHLDAMDLKGIIALQVHDTATKVWFRNIRIQDLGEHRWKPLWNGQDTTGWTAIGKGNWEVRDGYLAGSHKAEEKEFGHLVSNRSFGDVALRVKYRSHEGNSGFYFHIDKSGPSGVSGFQAEIDPENDAGGLYETNGRGWVVKPSPGVQARHFKAKSWNEMAVYAHKDRISVTLNGFRTADLRNDVGRTHGPIALQLHGSQNVRVDFKAVDILTKHSPQ